MGTLFGVGVGPGDPELMTLKAQRVLTSCPVIGYFAARQRTGNGLAIVENLLKPSQKRLRFTYPLTTEDVTHETYEERIAAFYEESATQVAEELEAGRDVAVVSEGDPLFYGSYMHLHERLANRFQTEIVPGVTSFSAAAAAAGRPLVSLNESFTVLPGVMPNAELEKALEGIDAGVVMKVGRHLPAIREAAEQAGVADRAVYVERASCHEQRVLPLRETEDVKAPYFSLVLIPGTGLDER